MKYMYYIPKTIKTNIRIKNNPELFKRWLRRSKKDFRGANFSCADFRDIDFRGIDFRDIDFRGIDFSGADFRGANFRGANYMRANFSDVDFRGVDFRGVDFNDIDFKDTNFSGAEFKHCLGDGVLIKTMQLKYDIVFVKCILAIGCEQHLLEDWKNFSDLRINSMDYGALDWWDKHKELIFKFCGEKK